MSIRLMSEVFDLRVSATEKLLLLAMADHAREDGTGCYPSVGRLATKTSLSRRGVQKMIRRLEAGGYLEPSGKTGPRGTIEYTLTLQNGQRPANTVRRGGERGSPGGGELQGQKPANPVRPNLILNRPADQPIRSNPKLCQDAVAELFRRPPAAAFTDIGFDKPFGQREFQQVWTRKYVIAKEAGTWLTQAMEDTIQECQEMEIGIPPQFFGAKHDVEARENVEFAMKHHRVPL